MFTQGFSKTAGIPGIRGGMRPLSKPARVTMSTRPGNPVTGLNGLTGAPAQEPFAKAMGHFGQRPKTGLVSRTGAITGARI